MATLSSELFHLIDNVTVDTYLSSKTCGDNFGPAQKVSSPNDANYLMCENGAGGFTGYFLNFFRLPPQVIKQTCDDDSRCAFFTVSNDRAWGYTGSYSGNDGHPDSVGYLKLPATSAHVFI